MKKLFTIFLLFISFTSFSQLKTPPASTASKIHQVVGLTEFQVEYNRPSKKGREIFGNLVPYGKLWRTGANSSTKISFSTDVVIDGKTIEEGTYSVFSIPNEGNWDIMLYSQAEVWGVPRDWDENKIIFKSNFKTKNYKDGYELETFTISFKNVTNNDVDRTALGATESVDWEYVSCISKIEKQLKDKGWKIALVEQTDKSIDLKDFHPTSDEKFAFVFGNEVFGVSDEALHCADFAIEIPQFGTKHSFNLPFFCLSKI